MARSNGSGQSWPYLFRVFTVLCAVILLLAQDGAAAASGGALEVCLTYEGLTRWAVPALFLLWGMFALEDGRGADLTGMSLGWLLPAFVTLVLWSAVYAMAECLLAGGGLSLHGFLARLRDAALGDTASHLWLLWPLLGLYLVLPVLRRFVSAAGRWEVVYFLVLCFLFASVLPLWSALSPHGVLPALLERLRVHLVLGFAGCFVGGWYLRHYTIGRVPEFLLYILGVCGMILTLMGDRLLGGGRALWYDYTAPGVVLTAAAFATLFRYVLGISDERSRRQGVRSLGGYVFGVYLIHRIWVLLFRWLGFGLLDFNPLLSIPLLALLVFVLSIPFAWLLGRIPGAGRWLTGSGQ